MRRWLPFLLLTLLAPGLWAGVNATAPSASGYENRNGSLDPATYVVEIKPNDLQTRTDIAIENGLWFLHKSPNESIVCQTASVLHAFGIHGHRLVTDPLIDPYSLSVRRAFNSMWMNVTVNANYTVNLNEGGTSASGPMNDANRLAIDILSNDHSPYQLGMVMNAIAASDLPLAIAETGPVGIKGRRFIDLARDAVDMYAWGQNGQGGWQYTWNGGSDNSACQWAAIGSLAVEEVFGIRQPDWVHVANLAWLASSYNGSGTFGYGGPSPAFFEGAATTPSGMIQLAWDGITTSDPRWIACEHNIRTNLWNNFYKPPVGGNPETYSLFDLVKAMRLAKPRPVVLMDGFFDWYSDEMDGVQARLQRTQRVDGSWGDSYFLDTNWGHYPNMSTAWCVVMLSPSLFTQDRTNLGNHPPVVAVKPIVVPTDVGKAYAQVTFAQLDIGTLDPDSDHFTTRLMPEGPYPVGENMVAAVATDDLGLSSFAMTQITVVDREAPVVRAPAAISLPTDPGKATATRIGLGTATATDNVGVVSLVAGGSGRLPLGPTSVVWTATDAAGNNGQSTQIVTVVDRESPVIIPPPSVVRWIGNDTTLPLSAAALGTPTATDNVGVTITTSNAPMQFAVGETRVIWTAQDAAGNQAKAVQIVDVRSGSPKPEVRITSPGSDIVFAAGSAVSLTAEVPYANQGDVARVEFFIDGNLVGADTTAPYGVTWGSALPGSHTVSALATCNQVAGVVLPAVINGKPRVFRVATPAQVQEVAP